MSTFGQASQECSNNLNKSEKHQKVFGMENVKLCVCLCDCVCVCVCVCVCTCMCTCMHMCTCMCMRVSIQQLLSATTDEDVKAVVSEGNDTILNCGYTKPLSKLCLDNCSQVVDAMLLHHFVLSRVAQLEQFREGL